MDTWEEGMTDPSPQLFANYARHYDSMAVVERLPDDLERLKRDRLPRWIDEVPKNSRILDAGCAQGHLLAALYRVGFADLTGVDLSAQLLQTAAQLVPAAKLVESDIRAFLARCPDGSFDLVFFHDVLEHLPREATIPLLQAFQRVLAPGGRLSLRVPNMGALIGSFTAAIDFTHITHFSEYSLTQVLEAAGFDVTKVVFECQAPRLFWSWRRPHRAALRLLNRLRWHLNNALHRAVYLLVDMHPRPHV
ncbi:class I SAM-dependent methyltransferase, partial [Desulfosoma sp.]|uniref:class I SAM-dependent methyltransferase n=1 Tax=Desulfosoma sp. TaxID=2603217 RepID=UPI00404B73AA